MKYYIKGKGFLNLDWAMRFLSFFLFLVFLVPSIVLAGVDQALIDNVYKMTSPKFMKGTDEISRPVQTVNMLAHELSLYADEGIATNVAKSIISMVAKGEGVKGGLRKVGHRRRIMNKTEKELVIDAVTKAADYLQRQGLFDDFLASSEAGMQAIWSSDAATRKHGEIVLRRLGQARTKSPNERYEYNAILWKLIETNRVAESARGIPATFPAQPLTPANIAFINALAAELETTVIHEKALMISKTIIDSLKHAGTDLRDITRNREFHNAVIRAMAAVEKFRMFIIGTDDTRPTVFDYLMNQNPETKAVLVAIINAIQNYLYNPSLTVPSLQKLFSYQINDHRLGDLEAQLKGLNPNDFINEDLREILSAPIRINFLQNILIDQENLKQNLRFFWMPTFDKETGLVSHNPTFVRYYGSSGVANQCGFFSLGFRTRAEAKQQIIDNLKDPEIFALADRISGASSRIKQLMERFIRRKGMTEAEIRAEIDAKVRDKITQLEEILVQQQEAKKLKKVKKQMNEAQQTLLGAPKIKGLKAAIKALEDKIKEQRGKKIKLGPEITRDKLGVLMTKEAKELEIADLDSIIEDLNKKIKGLTDEINEEEKVIKSTVERQKPEITRSVSEIVNGETAEKMRTIPEEARAFINALETKDNADTTDLLGKIEGGEDPADFYLRIQESIEKQKEQMDGPLTLIKRAAGFPEKIPDAEEIALWIMLHEKDADFYILSDKEIARRTEIDKGSLNTELSARSRRTLTFPIKFTTREQFKGLVTPARFDKAEAIATRASDALRGFNAQQRTLKTIEIESDLSRQFYSLEVFRSIIWQDMHNVFAQKDSGGIWDISVSENQELLEFPPNPEWQITLPTYPLLIAKLNGYSIGGWTSKSYLGTLQTGRVGNDRIRPIYQTENDEEYALVSYIPTTEDAKRVDVVNLGGGHFEKLIRSYDRPQGVRALRHKSTYRVGDTRPR